MRFWGATSLADPSRECTRPMVFRPSVGCTGRASPKTVVLAVVYTTAVDLVVAIGIASGRKFAVAGVWPKVPDADVGHIGDLVALDRGTRCAVGQRDAVLA